ncbi:mucin-13 [Leptodactylus fuscus]|uniref:mucin-13 n=1 Tax=Leptodactylus fuscus TaxID=238119 RepID=UPI003F4E82D7
MRGLVVICVIFMAITREASPATESTTTLNVTTTEINTRSDVPAWSISGVTTSSNPGNTTATPETSSNTTATPETSSNTTATPETSSNTTATPETSSNTTATPETSSNTTAITETSSNTTAITETSSNTTATPETSSNTTAITETSSNTTATPETSSNTTATPETSSNTTATPETSSNTTATPETSSNTTAITETSSNATAMDHTTKVPACSSDPCGSGSTCLQLFNTFQCECPLTYYYNTMEKTCNGGKSFFGELTVTVQDFNSNPETEQYTTIYQNVINQLDTILKGTNGYQGTAILEMSLISSKSKTRSIRSAGDVAAKVSHMFTKETPITADDITTAIQISNIFNTYVNTSICDMYCDAETTTCVPTPDGQGATCACTEGKYSNTVGVTVTSCRDCSSECYNTEDKYCKETTSGGMCECSPGYQSKGDKCEKCGFGYSGEQCRDYYLLVLVIVGVTLGAAVIALLGAVICVSVSSKKGNKSADRAKLIDQDERSESSPAPMRLFPKVQAKPNLGQEKRATNVYEEHQDFPQNLPTRDYDQNPWYEMDRKDWKY